MRVVMFRTSAGYRPSAGWQEPLIAASMFSTVEEFICSIKPTLAIIVATKYGHAERGSQMPYR